MSTLKADTIQNTSGGAVTLTNQVAAKARGTINYSGGTPSISDDFNVSSIGDTSVGNVDVNFTNAMSSTTYQGLATANFGGTGSDTAHCEDKTASDFNFNSRNNGSDVDIGPSDFAIFGDLA